MAAATTAAQGTRQAPSNASRRFWDSTIGKKVVMAVSGLIMAGFLVTHMTANLLSFGGAAEINAYSAFLHRAPEILWPARAVLLASLILHVTSAYQLTRLSNAARPVPYTKREAQAATIAARTIRWGGVLLAVFIVYHLLHFTLGTVHPDFREGDPYANIVTGFSSQRGIAAFYIVMMMVLGLHLYHGFWSAIRTLGLARPSNQPQRRRLAAALAIALWLGFTAVPVGVLLGLLPGSGASNAISVSR
jgi:succinate dehydrogenase / fumarate reductase cytochrome b subunit